MVIFGRKRGYADKEDQDKEAVQAESAYHPGIIVISGNNSSASFEQSPDGIVFQ